MSASPTVVPGEFGPTEATERGAPGPVPVTHHRAPPVRWSPAKAVPEADTNLVVPGPPSVASAGPNSRRAAYCRRRASSDATYAAPKTNTLAE